jgi:hypothetical protein
MDQNRSTLRRRGKALVGAVLAAAALGMLGAGIAAASTNPEPTQTEAPVIHTMGYIWSE